MSMQTKVFQIRYRENYNKEFQILLGADGYNLSDVEMVARAYAEDHPDYLVQITSSDEGFEVGYKFKSQENALFRSYGYGWQPYAE